MIQLLSDKDMNDSLQGLVEERSQLSRQDRPVERWVATSAPWSFIWISVFYNKMFNYFLSINNKKVIQYNILLFPYKILEGRDRMTVIRHSIRLSLSNYFFKPK